MRPGISPHFKAEKETLKVWAVHQVHLPKAQP